jgi:hypothetical protein
MDHEPNKRRPAWFGKASVGRMWQRTSQDSQQSDTSMAQGQTASKGQGSRWPKLPKWPPLPGGDPAAADLTRDESAIASDQAPQTEQQSAPPWEEPTLGQPKSPGRSPSSLWRFWSASRRQQVGLAAVAGIVILTVLLGVIVLGGAFRSHVPNTGNVTPATGRTGGAVASTTVASLTPTISTTSTPARATPTPAFVITFTCASGTVGKRGAVCIHTRSNAIVTLTVRYCDGSYASGKSLRGNAHTDDSGNYIWNWNVTTKCVGTATATVVAKSSGHTVTQSTRFTITN